MILTRRLAALFDDWHRLHWRDPFADFFHAHKGCLHAEWSYEGAGDRPRWHHSYGFVLQLLQVIEANTRNVNVNILPESGAAQAWLANAAFRLDAPTAEDNAGIVVGTGTTAEASADRALVTKIVEGSGAGQLNHGSSSFVAAAIVGANTDYVCTRPFTNNSGGSITVQEIGMFAGEDNAAPTNATNALMCRDLTGAIVHTNGTTRTGQYTWRTTV